MPGKNPGDMKRDWSSVSALNHGASGQSQVLRALLEERYPDLPLIAFNRLITGPTFFVDAGFSRRRSQFSDERIFCALFYLNRFLLGLPPLESVPLHRLERELYEPRLLAFHPAGAPLEIVKEEPLENSK